MNAQQRVEVEVEVEVEGKERNRRDKVVEGERCRNSSPTLFLDHADVESSDVATARREPRTG